jgi:hypothetical protein
MLLPILAGLALVIEIIIAIVAIMCNLELRRIKVISAWYQATPRKSLPPVPLHRTTLTAVGKTRGGAVMRDEDF